MVDEPHLLINQVCLEPGQNVPEHQANSNVTHQVVQVVKSYREVNRLHDCIET